MTMNPKRPKGDRYLANYHLGDRPLTNRHNPLFRFACRLLQSFLLGIFGFTLFCVLSSVFGAFDVAVALVTTLGIWIGRLAMLVFGVMAAAVVSESLSH